MDFPAFASKVAERITAFNIHTMYFIFSTYLKTINTVQLGIGYNQSKWCILYSSPIILALDPSNTFLQHKQKLTFKNGVTKRYEL